MKTQLKLYCKSLKNITNSVDLILLFRLFLVVLASLSPTPCLIFTRVEFCDNWCELVQAAVLPGEASLVQAWADLKNDETKSDVR